MSTVRFDGFVTGLACQQWSRLIDRVNLSTVGVDVFVTGLACQQWILMSY